MIFLMVSDAMGQQFSNFEIVGLRLGKAWEKVALPTNP